MQRFPRPQPRQRLAICLLALALASGCASLGLSKPATPETPRQGIAAAYSAITLAATEATLLRQQGRLTPETQVKIVVGLKSAKALVDHAEDLAIANASVTDVNAALALANDALQQVQLGLAAARGANP